MKKQYIPPAKLPPGAYQSDLASAIGHYAKKVKCKYGCKFGKGVGWINQECPTHHIVFKGAPIIEDDPDADAMFSLNEDERNND